MIASTPEALAAFHAALAEVRDVVKSKTANTGSYQYSYATLEQVLDSVKEACSKHGLMVTQEVTGDGDKFALRTTLIHKEGLVEFAPLVLPLPRDAQALGSAATYARRYSLVAIFAIAVEDDDGQEATRQARNEQQFGGNRTAEELAIRAALNVFNPDDRKVLTAAFKAEFKCGLAELPERRHADAYTWLILHHDQLLSAAASEAADTAAADTNPPALPPAGPSQHVETEPSPAAAGEGGTTRARLGSKAATEAAQRALTHAGMTNESEGS